MQHSDRCIVHLDLDTFFVSVERLHDKNLLGKPVLIGGSSDRGVVASCSYEARKFGIHSAMPMKMARKLCKEAIIISGNMSHYSKYSNLVTNIIAQEAPIYEKASIDEHYLDITGLDKYFGNLKWAKALRNKIINETGLPISFGISTNKTIAKIATGEAKPNGLLHIPSEDIQNFLNPLSIKKIPMVGIKTCEHLYALGISTIEDLCKISMENLEMYFGKAGIAIWNKAHGIDHTPVFANAERKSISTEQTFETDLLDSTILKQQLIGMVEKVAFQLRKKQKLAAVLTLKIRHSDFSTHTLQKQIPYSAFDHVIIQETLDLFNRLYKRNTPIRLIGVKVSNLVGGKQQLNMFDDNQEMTNLYHAMDKVKQRFGEKYVQRAIGIKTSEEQKEKKSTKN